MNDMVGVFYYKGIGSVPTTSWYTLRDKIQTEYASVKAVDAVDFVVVETAILASNYTSNFNGLFMTRLHPTNLGMNKDTLWKYIIKAAFISVVFYMLVVAINFNCLWPLCTSLFSMLWSLLKSLYGIYKNMRGKS